MKTMAEFQVTVNVETGGLSEEDMHTLNMHLCNSTVLANAEVLLKQVLADAVKYVTRDIDITIADACLTKTMVTEIVEKTD